MFRVVLAMLVAAYAYLAPAAPAQAWSENDCLTTCRQTASDIKACIANNNCSKYRGQPSAGAAAVSAKIQKWNANNSGSTSQTVRWEGAGGVGMSIKRPRSYGECMANGVILGYSQATNAAHCELYFTANGARPRQ